MVTTRDDLRAAFAGESEANRKYASFAEKARQEGFAEVAKLFEAASAAEAIHAAAHLRNMDGVGATGDNLEAAIAGETYEYKEMYPPMVARAAEEKNARAQRTFEFAVRAEERHAAVYAQALAAVRAGKDLATEGVYVCPVCGNIILRKPDAPCEICNTAADRFRRIG